MINSVITKNQFGHTPQLILIDEAADHQQYLTNYFLKTGHQAANIISLNQEKGENSLLSIDLVRDLISQSRQKARHDQNLIYLLLHLEKSSLGAQNALLKILEEPPAGLSLILSTTDINAILPTIISRCSPKHILPEISANTTISDSTPKTNLNDEFLEKYLKDFKFGFWQEKSYGQIMIMIEDKLKEILSTEKEAAEAAAKLASKASGTKITADDTESKTTLERRAARKILASLTQEYHSQMSIFMQKNPAAPSPSLLTYTTTLTALQNAATHLRANVSPRLVLENCFFGVKKVSVY